MRNYKFKTIIDAADVMKHQNVVATKGDFLMDYLVEMDVVTAEYYSL